MARYLRSLQHAQKLSFRPSTLCLSALRSFYAGTGLFGDLEKAFQTASAKVKTLKQDPGNDHKLNLYALFKQASVGKCNEPKPGAFDFVGKAKWTAWNNLGDLSKIMVMVLGQSAIKINLTDAQQKYIDYVNDLAVQFGSSDAESKSESPADTATAVSGSYDKEPTMDLDGGLLTDDEPESEALSAVKGRQYKELAVNLESGLLTVRMNRPAKYNAITWEMYQEFMTALDEAGKNDACVVAMVTGAGDYYCSGNDLSNFTRIPPEGPQKMARDAREVLKKFVAHFIDFPKPLIAAVNGPAVGISVTIMGLFDLVYASDKASFHTPFMELGQSPEGCSSFMFPRIMGPAKANEMLLAGRKLTAVEARDCGLVTDVIPHDKFEEEIQKRVQAMAKLPPKSLRLSKQIIRDTFRDMLHDINEKEAALLEERWLSEECMQAIMNFMARKSKT